ncbi:hypothetical protein B0I27_11625 [Arcticibacter pallidicorallinus]|uniref:Type IV leader peptidase family protein n=1 Tax=Arcticibacter pallidicorallinus TaxID=1259464 RepID=A0A2T0TR24_9SPHI|nr:hypothetical protein [Arcticibacter pallidicorallinus]PRY48091.1 hypothetical protein B0I27_11625 [Arcticibacter pallidicorallinus]
MLTKIVLIVWLLLLFAQDMRWRAVYWWMYPVLTILLILDRLSGVDAFAIMVDTSWNLVFLSVQFLLLSLYFRIKYKTWTNLTREHIGWGDILFLLCLGCYLPPINYLFFYMLSLGVILLFSLLVIALKRRSLNIPLAGLQAMIFAVVLMADLRAKGWDVGETEWFFSYLEK